MMGTPQQTAAFYCKYCRDSGDIYVEKICNYRYKMFGILLGLGNIKLCIADAVARKPRHMEIMGRNYTSVVDYRFYSHILADRKTGGKAAFI